MSGDKETVEKYELQKTIHFKLQTWALDKNTGMIPAFIIPSFHFEPEDVKEFSEGGKFDKAYDEFRSFCLRKTPNLMFVAEEVTSP